MNQCLVVYTMMYFQVKLSPCQNYSLLCDNVEYFLGYNTIFIKLLSPVVRKYKEFQAQKTYLKKISYLMGTLTNNQITGIAVNALKKTV